ncbi:hypothetical protein [Paraburkholderia adhaesiva]|uniref:hypothetical protein n=1 Tax=Paraburkholderia adhaesiva TaxID=2883244 RepID=UPI001F1C0394|nr:hypothetical protein [Paraburkholderia adhaesiva]
MTRDEITQALASIGRHHTHAQRELVQLVKRLQKEGASMEPVESTDAPVDGPASVPRDPSVAPPTREEALATAKEVLREKLRGAGQSHLLHLVDQVQQPDLDALHRAAPAGPNPSPCTALRERVPDTADLEFLRDIFDGETLAGGRGRIGRGAGGLRQYEQDVRVASQADLKTWPSGFYTDHTNQATQFLFNQAANGWALLIEGLPAGTGIFTLHYGDAGRTCFFPVATSGLDHETREFLAASFRQVFMP